MYWKTYIRLAVLHSRTLSGAFGLIRAAAVPCRGDEEDCTSLRTCHGNGIFVLWLTLRTPCVAAGNDSRRAVFGRELVKGWWMG